MPAENVSLYAKWTINQYTISFEENGGSAVADITQDYGTSVSAPTAPTKTGHTFGGWYSDAGLTTAYTFSTMPAENITLYAKWTINQYTISFEENGGSAVANITQNYGTSVSAPTDPTRTGYTFGGWYSDAGLMTAYTFSTMPAENITLYAKWTQITLSAATADALFCTGESTTVNIDLTAISNLYSYQFQVSYDQTKASAAGAFVNSFFDTTTNAEITSGWNADWTTTPGICQFSVAKTKPDLAVTGVGTLAKITFTGVAPGVFPVTIGSDAVLTDKDGELLAPTLAAPLPLTVCGYATVSGFITLQGRSGDIEDAGTVTMIEQGLDNQLRTGRPGELHPGKWRLQHPGAVHAGRVQLPDCGETRSLSG